MEEEMIQYLLSLGVLEYVFDDEDGDPVYRMTPEAKDLVPDLYEEHVNDLNVLIFSLWMKNMISIIFDEDGEPLVGINENSENEDMIKELDKEEREALREITFLWNKKSEG